MRDEMSALVSAAALVDDAEVETWLLSAETDLMEEITATPALQSVPAVERPWTRRRVGRRLTVLAGAAAVTASALFVVQSGGETGQVWATEILEVAEAAPRLLLDDPSWRISRVDEFTLTYGEMTFTDGARELELRWLPGSEQPAAPEGRAEADMEESVTVVGQEATLRRYAPSPGPRAEADLDPMYAGSAFTAVWEQGESQVVAMGWGFAEQSDYEAVLGAVREVDVDAWLTAMPASVVRPNDMDAVVEEMLADIPTPAGFDPAGLTQEAGVRDRYQLGARVTGAVVCAWIGQWIDAAESSDAAAGGDATAALASSHDWAILREMDADGGYPAMVWAYADAIVNEAALPDGSPVEQVIPEGAVEGDTVLAEPIEAYRMALGCE